LPARHFGELSVDELKVHKVDTVTINAAAIMGGGWKWLESWSMMSFLTCVVEPSGSGTAVLVILVSVLHAECQYTVSLAEIRSRTHNFFLINISLLN
jgi:hypothetical protein